LFHGGKKLSGTDLELFLAAAEHHGRLAGRQRRPAQNGTRLAAELDLLSDRKALQAQVVRKRIDPFHRWLVSYHIDGES
jgi:hypothetical protein